MADTKRILMGVVGHLALFFINFCVMVGVIESLQLFTPDLPILNALVLAFLLIHVFSFLSVQLGIQVLEFIRVRMPTILVAYYIRLDDQEAIRIPLLDPTKSRLAVIILLLIVTGAPIIYPMFAIYGFFMVSAHLLVIALDPSVILSYFGIFLNWMPPIIALIVAMIIMSIVIVEFSHR